jgi:hypothetical protein
LKGERIDSLRLRVLQEPLVVDDLESSSVLDMTGVGEGQHTVKVEMFDFGLLKKDSKRQKPSMRRL